MTDYDALNGELILGQTNGRRARIECRFDGEMLRLTQALWIRTP